MAIIVETGQIIENANSYNSVQDFKDHCAFYGHDISAYTDNTKIEEAKHRGMIYIESRNFYGKRASEDQATQFPRINMTDRDGYAIGHDKIPINLKKAQNEATYRELINPWSLLPDVNKKRYVKRKKIDVLETEYFDKVPVLDSYRSINSLLIGLVYPRNIVELGRG